MLGQKVFIYVIPLIAVVVILLFGQRDKINKKSILQSLCILLAAIVLSQALLYFSRFITNVAIVAAIMTDVVLQAVIIFAETILFMKAFNMDGEIHIWTYIILICCIAVSAILYYLDYGQMFAELKNGIEDFSFLSMFTMYQPRFTILRRILALIPSADVIVERYVRR